MGGMAAQIPVKGDAAANDAAFAKVRADKEREAGDGHDGTWVAHPDLVPVAMEVFDRADAEAEPARRAARGRRASRASDLLRSPRRRAHRSRACARTSASASSTSRPGWRGRGAVPLYNLMEDAATAEICRTQIWQWLRHGATLDDGRAVTPELFEALLAEETAPFSGGRFVDAVALFRDLCLARDLPGIPALGAYDKL